MNRKLHNTFSALSVAAVLMTAGLIAATPVRNADAEPELLAAVSVKKPGEAHAVQYRLTRTERSTQDRQARADARAREIGARAEALAEKLQGTRDVGEILGQVAGLTAEIATESALNVAAEELGDVYEVSTVETVDEPAPPAAPKLRHSRRPMAMPYFSFAPRG